MPCLSDAPDRPLQSAGEVRPDRRGQGACSTRPLSRAQLFAVRSRGGSLAEARVMTEPRLLQNFSGGRAIVVTDRASSLDILTTSLDRLGAPPNPPYIFVGASRPHPPPPQPGPAVPPTLAS